MHLFRRIGGRVALAQHVSGGYILPELSFQDSLSTSTTGVFHYRTELEHIITASANAKRQRFTSTALAASLGFGFVPQCKWFICLRSHSPPKEATAQALSVLYMPKHLRGVREQAA
jgi:hypothetical protein